MEQGMSLCGKEALTVKGGGAGAAGGKEPTEELRPWQTLVMLWELCTLVTEVPTCTKSVHEHVQTQT